MFSYVVNLLVLLRFSWILWCLTPKWNWQTSSAIFVFFLLVQVSWHGPPDRECQTVDLQGGATEGRQQAILQGRLPLLVPLNIRVVLMSITVHCLYLYLLQEAAMAKLAASEAATFCSHQVGSRCRPLNGEGMTHYLIIAVTKGGGATHYLIIAVNI